MQIDIAKSLKDKLPLASKFIPRPVVSWLRRIVHEAEMNTYLERYDGLSSVEFIRLSLADKGITYHSEGLEKLDPAGRYIFASNHPFGGLDGVMLADEVDKRFGDVRVVVNDLLMQVGPLAPIFIPINKHGRQSPEYAKLYNDAFASDIPIITFPAGLCSRRIKGVVTDLPWKPNFIRRAIADKRDVVPVFVPGQLSSFFYRLSSMRSRLGIGLNVEMLFLVDEMFKQCGNDFKLIIGDPVPWQTLADGQRPAVWCEEVRRLAYALGQTRK